MTEKNEKPDEGKDKKEQGEIPIPEELPPAEFAYIVNSFFIQALMYMGVVPEEIKEKIEPNYELARFFIDLLEILEKKTKGNLTEEEDRFLSDVLHQSRITFLEAKKAEPKE